MYYFPLAGNVMHLILTLCRQKGAIEGASLALGDFATCLLTDPRIDQGQYLIFLEFEMPKGSVKNSRCKNSIFMERLDFVRLRAPVLPAF